MAVPVILNIQSVLGFHQWQPWVYQPFASNNPTTWTCSPLPPGCVFDPATGQIQGPATMPGVYLFSLQAQNADGASAPVVFALGIEASSFVQPSNILGLIVDVGTRVVSLDSFTQTSGATSASGSASGSAGKAPDDDALKSSPPLFWVKAGDDLILNIRFVNAGVAFDPDLLTLSFALKEFEPESILAQSSYATGADWARVGLGADASFRLYTKIDSPALRSALTNYEDDSATEFLALGEIAWTENNVYVPRVGPLILRSTTRGFGVMIPRNMIPD